MAISIAQFEAALDAHGADVSRWPQPLRGDANLLLTGSVEAQRLLAAAQTVDALLDTPAPKAPEGLADRIVSTALGKRDRD